MPCHNQNQQLSSEQRSTGGVMDGNISAFFTPHSSHPSYDELASIIADSKAWLASFARQEAHGEILSETDHFFKATAEEMLAYYTAKLITYTESMITIVADTKPVKVSERDAEETEELNAKIARCREALREVHSEDYESKERCLKAFLELPEDFEERSGKVFSGLFGLPDEKDESADDETELGTPEQQDERIEEEEEAKMRENVEEAIQSIENCEDALKFH